MSFAQANLGTNLLNIANIAGQGLTAFGQARQGQVEASINEFNSKIKQQEAFLIREKAKLKLVVAREAARRDLGTAEAQFAGRGVRNLIGSPKDVILQIAEANELDILIGQFNSDVDELNALNESKLLLVKADQSRTAGFINAGATLLGSLPDFAKFKFTKGAFTKKKKTTKPLPNSPGSPGTIGPISISSGSVFA